MSVWGNVWGEVWGDVWGGVTTVVVAPSCYHILEGPSQYYSILVGPSNELYVLES